MHRILAHTGFIRPIGPKRTLRSYLIATAAIVALAAVPAASGQTTWHADDDAPADPGPGDPTVSDPLEDGSADHPFDAIQEGIDAAAGGDTVLVANGTYTGVGNKKLDYAGRAITVRSENGPENCVIDCEHNGRGFRFHSGETAAAIVEGLTIVNGAAWYGAGVYCYNNSSPTITNCTISWNLATYQGGGVRCYDSNARLTNCTISGNSANKGGGVYCRDGSPTLTNCTFNRNSAISAGGGAYCLDSNPMFTNCILWGNMPEEISGSPVVTCCNVQGGWAGEGNIDADPLFAFADDLHLMAGSPCIDAGANDPVGGLPSHDPDGNARPLDGDDDGVATADMGAFELNPSSPSIAVSATFMEFFVPEGGANPEPQILSIRNCGGGTMSWEVLEDCSWFAVDVDTGESSGEVDDVSVSIDASGLSHGNHTCEVTCAAPEAVNLAQIVYVTLHVNTTLDVPGQYDTIQGAIDAAVPGDEVLVADGTYAGEGNRDLDFHGKAIAVRSENGPESCVIDCELEGRGLYFHSGEGPESIVEGLTITNGYIDDDGAGVHCSGSSPTITNCVIVANAATDNGGGIYCYSSSATISNCTINGNTADDVGGGVSCNAGNPTIANCTINGNWATGYDVGSGLGGGICVAGGPTLISDCTIVENGALGGGGIYTGSDKLVVTGCTVSLNVASGCGGDGDTAGGGVLCIRCNPTIVNCTIAGNTTGSWANGGGVYCYFSGANIDNCLIAGNSAFSFGGGICTRGHRPKITNCTIVMNEAGLGGGIVSDGGLPTVANSVLWGNVSDQGSEIALDDATLTVSYSDVRYGAAGVHLMGSGSTLVWGEGNLDDDPLLVDPDGPDDDPNTWEDNDCHLSTGSPCIDAGCNCAVSEDFVDLDGDGETEEYLPFDLDGEGRFFDDLDTPDSGSGVPPIVDMGAYEFGGSDSPPCRGDLDGDRDVDLQDLVVLLGHYGTTSGASGADGDMDCDGDVDLSDLADFLGTYGTVCG